ncbi:hypothetical protein GCM10017667_49020 [Streptomyces filamentosus]|uniref:Uncharacterized protein n=1 Tax=Streptomyces filamentosus TaxID=67294 RepID=A0A919EPG2_STRFL|nr:hypothetical protein GCM10017667_49020 [Streptomyces filamentosus]
MNGTIDGFGQGLITPVAGYIMARLGSAPGAPVHGPVGAQRTENAGPAPPRGGLRRMRDPDRALHRDARIHGAGDRNR